MRPAAVKVLNSSSSPGAQSHRLPGAARWAGFFAIAALASLLTLYRLGAADVCSYNEAVEGLFVQQIVEHHAGLFPLANGRDAMYKPPLFHWTALAIDRVLGINRVTAFNLRLSAALYAVSCLLLIVCFTYTIFGPRAALFAALVLLGSYQYVSQGRFGRVDMTLTFCETLALTAFLWWLRAWRVDDVSAAAWRYLFAPALGLGVLAKGPVGALIPLLSIAIFIAVNRYWKLARELFSPGSALLAIAAGSSWYVACFIRGHYDFLSRQLGSENFGRFFGTLGTMPPWYYVAPLMLNSVPLSLLAPVAVGSALMVATRRPPAQEDIALDSVQCLAIFWVVTVVFFTLAAYKRRTYLLPLWPPTAVLIGWWLQKQVPTRWRRIAHSGFIAIGIALIALNLVVIPRQEAKTCGQGSFRTATAQINRIVGPEEPLFIYGKGDPGMGDPAALLFYLDREAPVLKGELDDAPPGYVILPAKVWEHDRQRALGLEPILGPTPGSDPLILLRHGKAYAAQRGNLL